MHTKLRSRGSGPPTPTQLHISIAAHGRRVPAVALFVTSAARACRPRRLLVAIDSEVGEREARRPRHAAALPVDVYIFIHEHGVIKGWPLACVCERDVQCAVLARVLVGPGYRPRRPISREPHIGRHAVCQRAGRDAMMSGRGQRACRFESCLIRPASTFTAGAVTTGKLGSLPSTNQD